MIMHVLGLGETLKQYTPDGNQTIGCNDIWNFVKTDYVVCVDRPRCFENEPERMQGMLTGAQQKFFSHITEWSGLVKNFELIKLSQYRSDLTKLQTEVPFSNNSAFVACVMAYKLGAKTIITHGVDLHGHHKLGQDRILKHTLKDFRNLQLELFERGVELRCSSKQSALAESIGVYSPK